MKLTKRGTTLMIAGKIPRRRKVCAWCKGIVQYGEDPTSHVMCPACERAMEEA